MLLVPNCNANNEQSVMLIRIFLFIILLLLRINSICANWSDTECTQELNVTNNGTELFEYLTRVCNYDKYVKPFLDTEPVKVWVRIHVYYIEQDQTPNTVDFMGQLLLQLRWNDPRLRYDHIASNVTSIMGEHHVGSNIWIPNLYLTNERTSFTSAEQRKELLVTILPDGTVYYATRLKTVISCWVTLGRFPFDQEQCHINIDTWKFNSEDLTLEWEINKPVSIAEGSPYLTEYQIVSVDPIVGHPLPESETSNAYSYYNCSSLSVQILMAREHGFYIMDYYVPGALLVIVSWVSFWAAPDASPGRTLLGTGTMLTFISLGFDVGRSLPNITYIRSNDVWFIMCTAFIFCSLAEFAFVNTIWRYGAHKVQLKKPTGKYILRQVKPVLSNRRASISCPNSPVTGRKRDLLQLEEHERTVKSLSDLDISLPTSELKTLEKDTFEISELTTPTTMTMQEIAVWIDRKSRIIFPISFVIFNIVYWCFLWL